jgi:hypothetical protein
MEQATVELEHRDRDLLVELEMVVLLQQLLGLAVVVGVLVLLV